MNLKTLLIPLLAVQIFAYGCSAGNSRESSGNSLFGYGTESDFTGSLESATTWRGTGFEPSSPPFLDMSITYDDTEFSPVTLRPRTPALPYEDGFVVIEGTEPSWRGTGLEPIGPPPVDSPRQMLARTAEIRIQVENLDRAADELTAIMERYGAYSSSSGMTETLHRYTIRVPAVSYGPLVSAIAEMGLAVSRTENAEDVTIRYFDLEGRLATQRELLNTFRAYLARATTIQDILDVESRIAEVQGTIDEMGSDLRLLGNRVDFATVSLVIEGPYADKAGPTPAKLGERISVLFGGFGNFAVNVAVVLIGFVVYVVPILALVLAFVWLSFGRIGLLKKLWRVAMHGSAGRKKGGPEN
jgi:hypothetical protein